MCLRKLNHDCLTSTFAYLSLNQQVHFRLVCSAWYEPLTVCLGRHRTLAIQSIDTNFESSLRLCGRHQVDLPNSLLTLSSPSPVPSPALITLLGRLFPRLDALFCFVTTSTCAEQATFFQALSVLPIWRLQQLNLIIRNHSDHPMTDSLWRALESSTSGCTGETSRLLCLRLPNQSLPEVITQQTLRLLGTLETLQLLKMDVQQIASNLLPSNFHSLTLGALLLHPEGINDPPPLQLPPAKVNCTLKHLSIRCLRGRIKRPYLFGDRDRSDQNRVRWTLDFAIGSFPNLESFHFEITDYTIFPIFSEVTRHLLPLSHLTHLGLPGPFLLNALAFELSNFPCKSLPSIQSLSLLGFEYVNPRVVAHPPAESLGRLLGTVFPRLQKLIVRLHPDSPEEALEGGLLKQTMATRWLTNVKLQIKRDPSVRLAFSLNV